MLGSGGTKGPKLTGLIGGFSVEGICGGLHFAEGACCGPMGPNRTN